jgi:hypothetical protein
MGLSIKKHKNGNLTLTDSISGKVVVKNGTIDDAKKYLLIKKIWKFMDDMIEIDMDFPNGYFINDKLHHEDGHKLFLEWWLESCKKDNFSELIYNKMGDIITKFNLEEYFNPLTSKNE